MDKDDVEQADKDLAYWFWSIHPREIMEMPGSPTREEFYARHIAIRVRTAVAAAEQAQAARIAQLEAQLDQARIEGVRMGIEAAVREADTYAGWHHANDDGLSGFDKMELGATEVAEAIRQLDPIAIAGSKL